MLSVIDVVAVELWSSIFLQKISFVFKKINTIKIKTDFPKRQSNYVKDMLVICFSVKPAYSCTTEKSCRFFGMVTNTKTQIKNQFTFFLLMFTGIHSLQRNVWDFFFQLKIYLENLLNSTF